MGLSPGMPNVPFFLNGGGLGVAAYFVHKLSAQEVIFSPQELQMQEQMAAAGPAELESPEDMLEMVVVDPIELEIGYSLIPMIDDDSQDNLLRRITTIRRQLMSEIGLILPVVRIRDNLRLQPQEYKVKIRGQEVASGELFMDRLLAIPGPEVDDTIPGVETTEPAFGLPALWIYESEQGQAELKGYTVVNPFSVLSTHLTEVVRNNSPELLSRQMVQEILNQIRKKSPASVEGVVPEMISLGELQAILRNLLRERVPIRDLVGILEVIANNAAVTRDPNILAEAVRQTMANTLSNMYRDQNNMLHVFTFAPNVESKLRQALAPAENGPGFQIDAMTAQQIVAQTGEQMENLAKQGFFPILLCPRELRLAFRRLVEQSLPNLVVLAFSEVSPGTRVKAHGMVQVNERV
jgi:flagellar biosynthesis protein FlhA